MDIMTVFGQVKFDSNGQGLNPFSGVQKLELGQVPKVVAPLSTKEVDLVYPMPTWRERKCFSKSPNVFGIDANGACNECAEGYFSEWKESAGQRFCVLCP